LQGRDGFGGDLVAVGFGDGDGGSGGGEGLGEVVAGFGGADEEEGFAWGFGKEGFDEGFGDVARGDQVDGEADGVGGAEGGRADGGDVFGELGEVEELGAAMEGFDGVGAGEEEPVVGAEAGEGGVEGGKGCGGDDFDGGDEDGGRAECFELGGEVGGLVAGAGDEDAFVGEGQHWMIVWPSVRGSGDGRVVAWIRARGWVFEEGGGFDFVGVTRLVCRAMEETHADLYFTLPMDTTRSTNDQGKSEEAGRREESPNGGWDQVTELLFGYREP
jgi:hypothetical protein